MAARKKTGKAAAKPAEAPRRRPGRPALTAGQMAVRNTLMVTRKLQGWSWEAIAGEAGISVSAAKGAVRRHVEAQPMRLRSDPVQLVQQVFDGLQMSIGDFEAIAAAAMGKNQLAVAVGAKKGANDAREKIVLLLQQTGRLPQDMGQLRHLMDLRAIAVRMLDAMDSFERETALIAQLEGEEDRRVAAVDASRRVRLVFDELVGAGVPDQIEGSAEDG